MKETGYCGFTLALHYLQLGAEMRYNKRVELHTNIPKLITKYLSLRTISDREFAKIIGLNSSDLSRIKTGKQTSLSLENWCKLNSELLVHFGLRVELIPCSTPFIKIIPYYNEESIIYKRYKLWHNRLRRRNKETKHQSSTEDLCRSDFSCNPETFAVESDDPLLNYLSMPVEKTLKEAINIALIENPKLKGRIDFQDDEIQKQLNREEVGRVNWWTKIKHDVTKYLYLTKEHKDFVLNKNPNEHFLEQIKEMDRRGNEDKEDALNALSKVIEDWDTTALTILNKIPHWIKNKDQLQHIIDSIENTDNSNELNGLKQFFRSLEILESGDALVKLNQELSRFKSVVDRSNKAQKIISEKINKIHEIIDREELKNITPSNISGMSKQEIIEHYETHFDSFCEKIKIKLASIFRSN